VLPRPFVICMDSYSPRDASANCLGNWAHPRPDAPIHIHVHGLRRQGRRQLVLRPKDGFFGTLAGDGIFIGRAKPWFASVIIHELGHTIDSTLASPNAVHPNPGSALSESSAWRATQSPQTGTLLARMAPGRSGTMILPTQAEPS